MPTDDSKKQLLGFLGLCRKAGKLICGTPQVCDALGKKKQPYLVLAAHDSSEATRKKLRTQTEFYRVPLYIAEICGEELAHAVGKSGLIAAVAVTDSGMGEALLSRIEAMEKATAPRPNSTGKEPSAREGKDTQYDTEDCTDCEGL